MGSFFSDIEFITFVQEETATSSFGTTVFPKVNQRKYNAMLLSN